MDKLWKIFEKTLYLFLCKFLHIKFHDTTWRKMCQFVQFGLVGLSNTLISYVVYLLFVSLHCHYLIASFLGFLISVSNAYFWNNKYVFRKKDNEERIWWKTYFRTFISYAGTGLILNNVLLILWIDVLETNEKIGPLINLFITIPLNFILNKFWTFRQK